MTCNETVRLHCILIQQLASCQENDYMLFYSSHMRETVGNSAKKYYIYIMNAVRTVPFDHMHAFVASLNSQSLHVGCSTKGLDFSLVRFKQIMNI